MIDRPLPLPTPDWDHPQETDAPTPEEVEALAVLRRLVIDLPTWLAEAATAHRPPRDWLQMAELLHLVAVTCAHAAGPTEDVPIIDEGEAP